MAKKVTETKPAAKSKAPPAKAAPAKAGAKAPAKVAAPVKAAPTTVTMKHLAAGLVERTDMGKKEADTLISAVFSQVVDHLKAGERVRIGGLGIIEVKDRPARMGRNPATGEAIQIKASKKIAFRPAKELKEAI
jgi:DNA-binding protein HU-beta